eukprot:gene3175-2157_t
MYLNIVLIHYNLKAKMLNDTKRPVQTPHTRSKEITLNLKVQHTKIPEPLTQQTHAKPICVTPTTTAADSKPLGPNPPTTSIKCTNKHNTNHYTRALQQAKQINQTPSTNSIKPKQPAQIEHPREKVSTLTPRNRHQTPASTKCKAHPSVHVPTNPNTAAYIEYIQSSSHHSKPAQHIGKDIQKQPANANHPRTKPTTQATPSVNQTTCPYPKLKPSTTQTNALHHKLLDPKIKQLPTNKHPPHPNLNIHTKSDPLKHNNQWHEATPHPKFNASQPQKQLNSKVLLQQTKMQQSSRTHINTIPKQTQPPPKNTMHHFKQAQAEHNTLTTLQCKATPPKTSNLQFNLESNRNICIVRNQRRHQNNSVKLLQRKNNYTNISNKHQQIDLNNVQSTNAKSTLELCSTQPKRKVLFKSNTEVHVEHQLSQVQHLKGYKPAHQIINNNIATIKYQTPQFIIHHHKSHCKTAHPSITPIQQVKRNPPCERNTQNHKWHLFSCLRGTQQHSKIYHLSQHIRKPNSKAAQQPNTSHLIVKHTGNKFIKFSHNSKAQTTCETYATTHYKQYHLKHTIKLETCSSISINNCYKPQAFLIASKSYFTPTTASNKQILLQYTHNKPNTQNLAQCNNTILSFGSTLTPKIPKREQLKVNYLFTTDHQRLASNPPTRCKLDTSLVNNKLDCTHAHNKSVFTYQSPAENQQSPSKSYLTHSSNLGTIPPQQKLKHHYNPTSENRQPTHCNLKVYKYQTKQIALATAFTSLYTSSYTAGLISKHQSNLPNTYNASKHCTCNNHQLVSANKEVPHNIQNDSLTTTHHSKVNQRTVNAIPQPSSSKSSTTINRRTTKSTYQTYDHKTVNDNSQHTNPQH